MERRDWPLRRITASVGVATLESSTISSRQLVDQCYHALHRAKQQGGNRTVHSTGIPCHCPASSEDNQTRSGLEYVLQM